MPKATPTPTTPPPLGKVPARAAEAIATTPEALLAYMAAQEAPPARRAA